MSYKLDVQVGGVTANDVAEVDPYSLGVDGKPQKESVWVSYFGNGGDLSPSLALVSDALKGAIDDHSTEWIPPAEPGFYSIWAVLRDQRGGSSVIRRIVQVR